MFTTIEVSPEALARLLNLPKGVGVASAHTTFFRQIQIVIADPQNKIPKSSVFNEKTRRWNKCSMKGTMRGTKKHKCS